MSLWYIKIDPSQNQDLNTSLEKPYKKLLNALFNFQIRYSKLKLWAVKKRPQNDKNSLCSMGYSLWYINMNSFHHTHTLYISLTPLSPTVPVMLSLSLFMFGQLWPF